MNDPGVKRNSRFSIGPYLSIYNRDYVIPKRASHGPSKTEQEFKDPIAEGFKECLQLDSVETDEFLEKVKKRSPKIAEMHFSLPLNNDFLRKYYNFHKSKTIYQNDYCDLFADAEQRRASKQERIKLPDDTFIPLSTQRYSYRNPQSLKEHLYQRTSFSKPADNLGQNEKINKILKVQTGDSEYMECIGKLGQFITENELHGKIDKIECSCKEHHPELHKNK